MWGMATAMVLTLTLTLAPAVRADSCISLGATQFIDGQRICVSSVLGPQAGNDYGPDNLIDGNDRTAWCEGAAGLGIGQRLSVEVFGGPPFSMVYLKNGYGKSTTSYYSNARPRTVEFANDAGARHVMTLPDSPAEIDILIPGPPARRWVTMTILDVYPGTKYQDTCLNAFGVNFEWGNLPMR
ncbi:hypothetical protein CKO19_08110 [Rhodovulum adriaticum]|nr:hypothetical protein [Rhodovulum adriaticum]